MATTIRKPASLKDKLKQLEKDPSANKALIAEMQKLLFGSGTWNVRIP